MVQVTLASITPGTTPTNGWIVGYRIKGTLGAYLTPTGSPFSVSPIVFSTTDPAGTLYEGFIEADCGYSQSTLLSWVTPCTCVTGYTPNVNNTECDQTTTVVATVTNSGYCLVSSTNEAYSNFGSRIYNLGFSLSTLMLAPGTADTYIYGNMSLNPQWANPAADLVSGPMNRECVWIDSNCDGNKDALGAGVKTTVGALFNNISGTRTIFVGVGADNQFKIVVNGMTIIDTGTTLGTFQFKTWHIMPVVIKPGVNYFNLIATGDGTVSDSMAMVLYDNTAAQILAATSDSSLSILYKSSNIRGTTFDIATCATGYSLDSSGGSGSYVCTKTLVKVCNSAS